MLKLMKLELRKFMFIRAYMLRLVIINLCLLGLMCLMGYVTEGESDVVFLNHAEMLTVIDTFVRMVFMIAASVLISKFIIDEYKNKSITVLFMYPINRKKLFVAKLLLVVLFTFFSILISNVFVASVMIGLNQIWPFLTDSLTAAAVMDHAVRVLIYAVAASGMSLIPLYFGMRKYSTPTTIVSSIIIAAIINSSFGNNNFTLASVIAIPLALACVGVFVAYLAIRNVERVDVVN